MERKKENLIGIPRGLTLPVEIMVHVVGAYIIALTHIIKTN
jgi:hypothetical protein